jgi:hypothetical protein
MSDLLLQHRKAVGTIAYIGGFMSPPDPFVWSFINMAVYSQEVLCEKGEFVHVVQSRYGLMDWARNEEVRQMQGDWIVMFDADQQFDPDTAARLVMYANRYKVDVVTGMYCYKNRPQTPVLYMWNTETQKHETVLNFDRGLDLFEIGSSGGGCLFIRRSVFSRILSELKEEPFSRSAGFGEDHSFYARLRKLGIKAYCAWRVQVGHLRFDPVMWDEEAARKESELIVTTEFNVTGRGTELLQTV